MIWILAGYIFLYVYRPFEYYEFLRGGLRVERTYMILTLFVWLVTFSTKTWTVNKNCTALFFVALVVMLSSTLTPYSNILESRAIQDWMKIFVFFLLLITCVRTEKELKILIAVLLVSMFTYIVHSLYVHLVYHRFQETMQIRRMLGIGNTFAGPNRLCQALSVSMVMLLPFWMMVRGWKRPLVRLVGYSFVFTYVFSVLFVVQRTGSRSGLLLVLIYILCFILMSKHRLKWLLLCAACAPIFWFILPDSMQNRFLSIIAPSLGPASARASMFGRIAGFWGGVNLWLRYPVLGVGLGNYMRASGKIAETHSLLGQLLGETGVIGLLAYFILSISIFLNQWEAFNLYRQLKQWGCQKEGTFLYYVSVAVLWGYIMLWLAGFAANNAQLYFWIWYAAFQGVAVVLLRRKVAAIRERLLLSHTLKR